MAQRFPDICRHLSSYAQEDDSDRVPLFCFRCTPQLPLEALLGDAVPTQLQEPTDQLASYLAFIRLQASTRFDSCVESRRHRRKRPGPVPSMLTDWERCVQGIAGRVTQAAVRLAVSEALAEARRYIFSSPALRDASTAALRHLCMGGLADGYSIHMRLTEDLEQLAAGLENALVLETLEQLEFLRSIENSTHLAEVCAHCVRSRASSDTKAAVRSLYLQLLALKHHTTPTQAQELVPGFTYDHIQSLDAVLELLDSPQPAQDAEILRFRQRLARLKPPPQRLRPRLSASFVARIQGRLRRP